MDGWVVGVACGCGKMVWSNRLGGRCGLRSRNQGWLGRWVSLERWIGVDMKLDG